MNPKEETKQNQQKEEQKSPEKTEETTKNGKYKITEFNGPIVLPKNYSTDDEDEFNAIQILNQDISSWKLQKDKFNIKIYSKLFKIINDEGKEVDNIVFFSDAIANCPARVANDKFNVFNLRSKWDKALEKGKLIKEENLSNNIRITDYYSYIKMPLFFSDRDSIIRAKTWSDYLGEKDCFLSHMKSIEHPDFPPKEKPVRAFYENGGVYIRPINEKQCKFYYIAKFDFKISAPTFMMEGTGSEGQLDSMKEFIDFCEK